MKKDIVRSLLGHHSVFAAFAGFLYAGFSVSLSAAPLVYVEMKVSGSISLLTV